MRASVKDKVSAAIDTITQPVAAVFNVASIEIAIRIHKNHPPSNLQHPPALPDDQERREKAGSKMKYMCPSCGLNARAKFGAALTFGERYDGEGETCAMEAEARRPAFLRYATRSICG
jgi:hypothetical protein